MAERHGESGRITASGWHQPFIGEPAWAALLHSALEDATRKLQDGIEEAIANGLKHRKNTAIGQRKTSEDGISATFDVIYLDPGEMPPPGQAWTIYHSAGHPTPFAAIHSTDPGA